MCPYYGAVYHDAFHVRVIREVFKQLLPYTTLTPPVKALVNTVPLAVLSGKKSPLRTAPQQPKYTFDKSTALLLLPHVHLRVLI